MEHRLSCYRVAGSVGLDERAPGSDTSYRTLPACYPRLPFLYWGPIAECQQLTLGEQLRAGIRVLDIRLRQNEDKFDIYHGVTYQFAEFKEDVLDVMIAFLTAHPDETILMSIKREGDPIDPVGTFREVLEAYLAEPTVAAKYWKGASTIDPVTGIQTGYNPPLSAVRGKFVILDRWSNAGLFGPSFKKAVYHENWGCDGQTSDADSILVKQGNYCYDTPWEVRLR